MAKILIVDDEPGIIKLLTGRLKANKYQVVSAKDGEEALAKARKEKFDLIITDLIMPKLNGYGVCKGVRQIEINKDIPIILLSAYIQGKLGDDMFLADLYMRKPFESQILVQQVTRLLEEASRK